MHLVRFDRVEGPPAAQAVRLSGGALRLKRVYYVNGEWWGGSVDAGGVGASTINLCVMGRDEFGDGDSPNALMLSSPLRLIGTNVNVPW